MNQKIEKLKNLLLLSIQILLLAWFITISFFLFVPSYRVLVTPPVATPVKPPPAAPAAPGLGNDSASNEKAVALYTKQVEAFIKSVEAYNAYTDKVQKAQPDPAYEQVVKGTLLPLLQSALAALLAYAFVVTAANTIVNAFLVRKDKTTQPLRFF